MRSRRPRDFLSAGQLFTAVGRETGVIVDVVGTTGMAPGLGATVAADFDLAYPNLFRAAYRVAFRLVGNRDDASDIAQEACARAYARWRKIGQLDSPEAWVSRVSGNLAIDAWRRRGTAAKHAPTLAREATVDHDRVDLHRALGALPRRQRQVVMLRYLADLPEAQVAATLGFSVGTVKSHASRGLAALRSTLALEEG